ncbi:MAG: hypothetical protein BM549_08255 [Lacinutrix sp. MedPE-SW]|nr:MAG: hypothetical protein BM549_08255 [Lacinutrix sp. MedPE-SW]
MKPKMIDFKADTLEFSDTNYPAFTENDFPLDWSMTRNERYGFLYLLQKIKPKVAIEIGTFNGGSLQVISKYADKVYAIDTDKTIVERLGNQFSNVEFLIGDSKEILPKLIKQIQDNGEQLEFALIDGDHSTKGVAADIKNLIKYKPQSNFSIVLHDSFNPNCRKGMKLVDYNANKHVHYVELDFISGVFAPDNLKREMWGGLAHIILLPEERIDELIINESQKKLFNIAYNRSIHFIKDTFGFLKPIKRLFKK